MGLMVSGVEDGRLDVRKEMNVEEEVDHFGQSWTDLLQKKRTLTEGDPSQEFRRLKISNRLNRAEVSMSLTDFIEIVG